MSQPTKRRDRGATIPIVALLLPILILMTAFAIDLGRQRSSRRTMQARADIVALDLVRLADGRPEIDVVNGDADHPSTETAKIDSANRNDVDPIQLTWEWGTWTEASGFIQTLDTGIPDAVRVTAIETTDYFFRPGSGDVTRSAIATFGDPTAGFSMGSFGASLDSSNAGLLNSLLTPLLGSPAGLDVLSYQGLAAADIGVGDLAAELGLLSPDAVFTEEITYEELALATAAILEREGDTANADLLRGTINPETQSLEPFTLGDFVSVEPGAEGSALASDINVLDLLTGAAFLSQCTGPIDPDNPFATCSALAIPAISTSVPLLSTTGSVRIIQGQVQVHGPVGRSGRTNQTQVELGAVVGSQAVGACTNLVACLASGLGLGGLVDATVTITSSLRLAESIGTIDDIVCPEPFGLDVLTRTGLYDFDVAVTVEFGQRGLLGGVLGPSLGSLSFAGTTNDSDLTDLAQFVVPPDEFGVTVDETGAGSVGLSTIALSPTGGTGVLGTLGTLGIATTSGAVLNTLVNPLLTQLDAGLLGPLTDLLGVNVVGADITPLHVDCEGVGLKLVE
jgi:uncharacterized membrane protein